jgi:cell division protein FtsQ
LIDDMSAKPRSAKPSPAAHGTQSAPGIEAFMRKRLVVIGAAFAAMLIAGGAAWLAIDAVSREATQMNPLPIRAVTFVAAKGEFKRVDAGELKRLAGALQNMGGSMLRTDLNQVRAAVRQIEWVRDAEVRRRFPGTLEIVIEEHTPFARWLLAGDATHGLLVNSAGEVFAAESDDLLPAFSGPQDSSREVMANYLAFKTQLAAIQRSPSEVRLSPRRAWQLKLDNGGTLELGRNDAGARLARYVRAYPSIVPLQSANARVDMRYQTGLAVRVARSGPEANPGRKTTKKVLTKT